MTQHITNEMLRRQIEMARKYSGLDLTLKTWTPGDGFTRYFIVQTTAKGIEYERGRYLKRSEMYDALLLFNDLMHAKADEEKKKKDTTAATTMFAADALEILGNSSSEAEV